MEGIVRNLSLLIPELLKLQKSWWKLTICVTHRTPYAARLPLEKEQPAIASCSQVVAELSLYPLGLSNEMQFPPSGPSMLNLWTTDANVSLEKEPVVLVSVTDATTEGEKKKKAYSHYDFAMAPTKSLKDFRCIWKLNSVGPPEPASLLNTRGTDNDKTQTRVLMQA